MNQSVIAIIILIVATILFATEKLPLSITTLLAMLAMVFSGILTPEQAFSGFSSTATLLLIGVTIIGEAFFTSGLVDKLGTLLYGLSRKPVKYFVAVTYALSAAASSILNGLVVMAIFIPVIDAVAKNTNGAIARKYTYLPLGIGAVIGGNLTVIGSTSMINASNLLGESYYGSPIGFFDTLLPALPSCVLVLIFYLTVGQKLQEKCFRFEEYTPAEPEERTAADVGRSPLDRQKAWITVIVMALCVVGFVSGANLAAVGLAGAVVLMITGCISPRCAYAKLSWETVFVVAASTGFASGIEASGAGDLIAGAIVYVFGGLAGSAFGVCVIVLIMTNILSNFMSNNAAVTIVMPIALALAQTLSYDPLPLAIACGIAANQALATPICTTCITMTTAVGYRFRHLLCIGGLVNLLSLASTILAFYCIFYS